MCVSVIVLYLVVLARIMAASSEPEGALSDLGMKHSSKSLQSILNDKYVAAEKLMSLRHPDKERLFNLCEEIKVHTEEVILALESASTRLIQIWLKMYDATKGSLIRTRLNGYVSFLIRIIVIVPLVLALYLMLLLARALDVELQKPNETVFMYCIHVLYNLIWSCFHVLYNLYIVGSFRLI